MALNIDRYAKDRAKVIESLGNCKYVRRETTYSASHAASNEARSFAANIKYPTAQSTSILFRNVGSSDIAGPC